MANKDVKLIISAKDQTGSVIQGIERNFASLKDSIFSMQGALSAVGITATLASATNAAKEAEAANIGLAVSARYAGQSIDGTLQAAQALTQDGLLTMTEASMGLKNLLSRGFSLDEATTLMNRFKDSAAFGRQASLGFGEAIVSATEGLKNENSILVDNAGVTKNVSVMWKEYATSIGTTADKLTQAQKREAEYKGVLIETEGQLGNSGRAAETMAGMQARLAAETTKAQIALGNSLTPALLEILPILTQLAGGVGTFIGGLQMMAVETAGFIDKINVLGSVDYGEVLFGDTTFDQAQAEIKKKFAIINQAIDEQKQEIFDKATTVTAPNIGKDSGARRKDVVAPAGGSNKNDIVSAARQMELDATSARVQAWVDGQKFFRDLQAEESAAARETYFSNLTIEKEMEIDSIRSRVDAWVAGEQAKKEASALNSAQMQMGIQSFYNITNGIALAGGRKALKTSQTINAGLATVSAISAAVDAMKDPSALTPAQKFLNYTTVFLKGMSAVAAIKSVSGGGGDGGGGGSGSGGGYGSPIVTQPAASNQQSGGFTLNVTIEGNLVGHEKYVEEVLAPSIRTAVQGRNINFGLQPATS